MPQLIELTAGRRIGDSLVETTEHRVIQLRRADDYMSGRTSHTLVHQELQATTKLLDEATLTEDPGAFGKARDLLATVEAGPLDGLASARADLLRGQIAFGFGLGSDAPPLLLKAAKRLEPLNLDLARQTYVDAWQAAFFAGHLAGAGDLLEVSRAARALPPPRVDVALDGFARLVTDGPAAAAPVLRQATRAFASADIPAEEVLRWGFIVTVADEALWDDGGWRVTVRQVQLAREAGALVQLPILLNRMGVDAVWSDDFTAATSLIAEADAVREATGAPLAPYAAMMLAAVNRYLSTGAARARQRCPTRERRAGHGTRPAYPDHRRLGVITELLCSPPGAA